LLSGALDEGKHVVIDSAPSSTVAEDRAVPSRDLVMMTYLTAFGAWNRCVSSQPSDATSAIVSSECGSPPAQPDDPQLNAYLAEVLDWNKCAAPRLRHGGLDQAVIACGPQPVSPIGN
jgi:hypothetical protein